MKVVPEPTLTNRALISDDALSTCIKPCFPRKNVINFQNYLENICGIDKMINDIDMDNFTIEDEF